MYANITEEILTTVTIKLSQEERITLSMLLQDSKSPNETEVQTRVRSDLWHALNPPREG